MPTRFSTLIAANFIVDQVRMTSFEASDALYYVVIDNVQMPISNSENLQDTEMSGNGRPECRDFSVAPVDTK